MLITISSSFRFLVSPIEQVEITSLDDIAAYMDDSSRNTEIIRNAACIAICDFENDNNGIDPEKGAGGTFKVTLWTNNGSLKEVEVAWQTVNSSVLATA